MHSEGKITADARILAVAHVWRNKKQNKVEKNIHFVMWT